MYVQDFCSIAAELTPQRQADRPSTYMELPVLYISVRCSLSDFSHGKTLFSAIVSISGQLNLNVVIGRTAVFLAIGQV